MDNGNSSLFCSDCQITYSTTNTFKNHLRKRHPTRLHEVLSPKKNGQTNDLMCDSCEQIFSSNRALKNHKKNCRVIPIKTEPTLESSFTAGRSILQDESIGCSDCELEFEDIISFKQHMRDHRDNNIAKINKSVKRGSLNNKSFESTKKSKSTTPNSKSLAKIKIKPESPIAESNVEGTDNIRKSRRSRKIISYAHLIASDSDSEDETLAYKFENKWNKSCTKHICNECHVEYDVLTDLQKHVRKHHPSKIQKTNKRKSLQKLKMIVKKFTCELCSTKFNNLNTLRRHIRKYHPAKWQELLPKLYRNKMKISQKTYSCTECKTIYGNIIGLRKHVRKYHSTKLTELGTKLCESKQENSEKTFLSCDECQIKYCNLISLRKHIKKEHPFKFSELSPKLYKNKMGHNKRHIPCSQCDMMYSNMSGLRKHIRKHHPNKLLELAPLLYTFKRNMAKNILMKKFNDENINIENLIDSDLIDMDKYKCNICESSYSNVSNLRKHLRKFHPEKLSDVAPLLKDNTNYKYPCELCSKKFNCIRNFRYHQRKCHPEVAHPLKRTSKHTKINKCPLCNFEHTERKKLLQHFKDQHDIEVSMSPVDVTTGEEFQKWKETFEKESNARFVKEYHFSCASHDVVSYICHRSGYYNPKGKGLRHMKAQGSSKINGYCPAAIKLKKMKDGSVKVTFCGSHIGHTTDLSHLHLTPTERQTIADKIAKNIPFKAILESMKDSVSESDYKRIHMLSKKDLYNIKSSFNLTASPVKVVKPKCENVNFKEWVEDVKKNGDCILFHKPQGHTMPEYPELNSEDFVLMIMNHTQRDKLKKFGHDTICLDRSFDLNFHQFELVSLLVLNETAEGFPCAFLVSNRVDREMLVLFFHYVKTNVGQINAKVFMSDMTDFFYTAWSSVMSDVQYRYYCTWLIEHSWKKKISVIKSKEKQECAMTKLKMVLEETNIVDFKKTLETVVQDFNAESYGWPVMIYLTENYLQNEDLWSTANVYIDITYNSHLERMHKTLKHLFLNGKNAKHFGKALGDTMRFIKDKLFDRTILINRGKINNKMKIAIFRHKLSMHSKTDDIIQTEDSWQIPSTETSEIYTITEIQPTCRCEFICSECKSCIHRFLCSCLDSSVKWNMCKHIHLLCRLLNSPEYVDHRPQQEKITTTSTTLEDYANHETPHLIYVKPGHVEYVKAQEVEYLKQPQQIEYVKQAQQIEFIKQQDRQVEYVKQPTRQISFIKHQPQQQIEHVQVQHIQVENHVNHVDQVESAYIYCNETNQREMDAILAEVNICNLETVQVAQVTQIPTSCTIQIPTSCTVVPQVAHISSACQGTFGEVVDTKESLKMKFLKLLEEASSPSELEVVQKMLASITPTLEVIKDVVDIFHE